MGGVFLDIMFSSLLCSWKPAKITSISKVVNKPITNALKEILSYFSNIGSFSDDPLIGAFKCSELSWYIASELHIVIKNEDTAIIKNGISPSIFNTNCCKYCNQ